MKILKGLFLAAMVLPAYAAQPAAKKGGTLITSDDLEMNFKPKQVFVYTGRVKVVDPDIDLLCDKMTVIFNDRKAQKKSGANPVIQPLPGPQPKAQPKSEKPPMMAQGGQIKMILAANNVVIINKKDKTRATGKNGVYTAMTNLLVLTGNPVLYHEGGEIRGEIITWDRVTGKLKVSKAKVNIAEKDNIKPTPKPKPTPKR